MRAPSAVAGYGERIEVRYRHFEDTRGLVLDGVERADYVAGGVYGGPALYTADVRVSGRHSGYLRARNVRIGPGLRGTIRSRMDRRALKLGPLSRAGN